MTKQEIRNYYLNLRLSLSDSEHKRLSQNICNVFFESTNLSSIQTVHVFLPIKSKKEPDTWLIIDRLTKDFSNIKISIPKMNEDNTLINFYFEGRGQIKDNKWSIPEPQVGEITPTEKIDLVIVPLLAFDLKGNRVGYGKGFYDWFLKECRPECKKVGLSFFEPVEEIAEINSYDVRLNAVLTPFQLFKID
jgi:5-formyltetrahydrofolate cyclo-ligase